MLLADVESGKGRCSSKVPLLPVAVIFFIIALILIGFIVAAVLLAIKLESLSNVSILRMLSRVYAERAKVAHKEFLLIC